MAKGWCAPHYYALRPAPECAAEGCDRASQSKGFCNTHYARFKRHGDAKAGRIPRGETQRWLDAHIDHDDDRCLIWPFARASHGYGVTTVGGRYALAHRVMCEKAHGAAPTPAHESAHSCGKGHEGCVHPRHLRWATKSENAVDAMIHGTSGVIDNKGENHRMAKLTEDDVRSIRRRRECGETNVSLAKEYGVHSSCISQVTNGPNWRHVV